VIVLDAGALIALLNDRDAHHEWALQMFIDTVGEDLSISALNLAEALGQPTKAGRYQEFMDSIHGLGLEVQGLDQADVSSLANIRAESGLRMPEFLPWRTFGLKADSECPTLSLCTWRSSRILHWRPLIGLWGKLLSVLPCESCNLPRSHLALRKGPENRTVLRDTLLKRFLAQR